MVFVGLMAFVLIATWCVNNWFLESFYTMDKVATLEKAYNGIDRIVTETEKKGTDIFEYFKSTYDPNRENEGSVQQMFQYGGALLLVQPGSGVYLWQGHAQGQYFKDPRQLFYPEDV